MKTELLLRNKIRLIQSYNPEKTIKIIPDIWEIRAFLLSK